MDAFAAIVDAIAKNPTAAFLALALLALAWVVRDARASEKESRAAERALQDAHAKELREAFGAHLQTAQQVAPLAAKLVDCVVMMERVTSRMGGSA